jgi:hypothetical protein
MKTIPVLVLIALLCGCRSPSGWTEATLGEGKYEISLPHLVADLGTTNNNPTLYIAECGRMWVEARPLSPGAASEVWVNWLSGGSHGVVSWSNDSRVIKFDLQPADYTAPGTTEIETEYGGTCNITLSQTNGNRIAKFTVWSDGTNAYLTLNSHGAFPKAEFVVKSGSNGLHRLEEIRDKEALPGLWGDFVLMNGAW